MGGFVRKSAKTSIILDKNTDKKEALTQMAEELYKMGVIKLNTEYNSKVNDDVLRCEASVWWDESYATSAESEGTIDSSSHNEDDKVSFWKKLFKINHV